jgi:hypothetical protein
VTAVAATLVAGRVIARDGNPVSGAVVMFSASPVPVPDVAQVTGPDGRFTLAAPEPGRYVVAVRAGADPPVELAVDVGAVPPPDLEIVVDGSGPP